MATRSDKKTVKKPHFKSTTKPQPASLVQSIDISDPLCLLLLLRKKYIDRQLRTGHADKTRKLINSTCQS